MTSVRELLGRIPKRTAGAATLAWLVLVAWEIAVEPGCTAQTPCRGELGPVLWLSGLQITAMLSWMLFLLAPLPGLWFNGVLALLVAVPDAHPQCWVLLGLALLALACWQTLTGPAPRPRPGTVATPPHGLRAPAGVEQELRDWASRHDVIPLPWLAPCALSVLLAAALLAWMVPALVTQHAFEDGSRTTRGKVVALSDVTPVVEVEGQRIQVSVAGGAAEDYRVGQDVEVRVNDAVPGRVELVAEPNDPSWRVGLAGLALAAGTWWWWARARAQRLGALADAPVRQTTGHLLEPGLLVLGHDGGRSLVPVPQDWPSQAAARAAEDRVVADGTQWPESPAGLTVEGLVRWADQFFDDEDPFPGADGGTPADDFPVAVLGPLPDGDVVVVGTPGRPPLRATITAEPRRAAPTTAPGAPRRAAGMPLDEPAPGTAGVPLDEQAPADAGGPAIPAEATSDDDLTGACGGPVDETCHEPPNPWLAFLRWPAALAAAVLGAILGSWALDEVGTSWWDWLRVVLAIGWAVGFTSLLGTGQVVQHRRGIVQLGALADDIWPAARISGIFPGQQAIAVRLRSPQDAVALHAEQVGGTTREAARTLQRWCEEASDAPGPSWRPGPLVPALAVAAVAMVLVRSPWFV